MQQTQKDDRGNIRDSNEVLTRTKEKERTSWYLFINRCFDASLNYLDLHEVLIW